MSFVQLTIRAAAHVEPLDNPRPHATGDTGATHHSDK